MSPSQLLFGDATAQAVRLGTSCFPQATIGTASLTLLVAASDLDGSLTDSGFEKRIVLVPHDLAFHEVNDLLGDVLGHVGDPLQMP